LEAGSQDRDPARLSELAAQFVPLKVDAIVALQEFPRVFRGTQACRDVS